MTTLHIRFFGGPAAGVFRGMATLAAGSGAARLIGIAAIPVLTRIYSPADYGVLSVFTALVAILTPLLTLRYVLAVPLPRHDGMAMNLMVLSLALAVGMSLALTLALWTVGPVLLALMSMQALSPYWWLISLALVGSGGYEMLTMWATRQRAYKPIAHTKVFQSALGSVVKILLGLLALKPLGLLIGQVVISSAGIGVLSRRFHAEFRVNRRHVTRRRLRLAASRYWAFPVYRLPSQFLLVVSTQTPLLLTAALYDAETTGQLGLALMALALPMGLLGRTMSNAYYAEIAAIGPRKPQIIRALTNSVLKRLFIFAFGPAIALVFFGPTLFAMIFGPAWDMAGEIASLLAIYLVFQFLQAPVAHILYVFEAQRLLLFLNMQRVILAATPFAAAYFFELPIAVTIGAYSVLLSAHYIFSILRTLKEISTGSGDRKNIAMIDKD